MTALREGPAVPKWVMALLLIGGVVGLGQLALSGTETTRIGAEQTTRFTRGLPFSPWYEEVETRTATDFATQTTIRLWSVSGLALLVGMACWYLSWRWRWRPGREPTTGAT